MDWFKKKRRGISNTIPKNLRNIVSLFEEISNGNVKEAYMDKNRLFINGGDEPSTQLYLRFEKNTIVIANAQFSQEGFGYCTRLLDLMYEFAYKEGYEIIELETVATEAIKHFAKKYQFFPKPNTYEMTWFKIVPQPNEHQQESS